MVIGNIFTDGFTAGIGSATETEVIHVFSSGTAAEGHKVSKFNLNIPGATADTTFTIYDGVSGTGDQLSAAIPLVSLPSQGIQFNKIETGRQGIGFNTGSISLIIKGNIAASRTVYGYLDLIY